MKVLATLSTPTAGSDQRPTGSPRSMPPATVALASFSTAPCRPSTRPAVAPQRAARRSGRARPATKATTASPRTTGTATAHDVREPTASLACGASTTRKAARPPTTSTAPRHSPRSTAVPATQAPRGTVKMSWVTCSGWATVNEPRLRATA